MNSPSQNSRPRLSWLHLLALAGLFVLGVAVSFYLQPQRIPPLELTGLDGSKITLPADKPTWVNFWSITCPPCMKEMPVLNTLSREYQQQLAIVAIAIPYDAPALVKEYQEQQQLTLPIALDIDGKAMRTFTDNLVVPSHYLLDSRGKVLMTHLGELDEATMRGLIEKHL
ncbi:MAG: TlpA disulfide reductase family protein [Thiolinea sp.]